LKSHRVTAPDGAILNAYAAGLELGQVVLFVNAFGISNGILGRISGRLLNAGIGLVSWESRGFPSGEGGFRNHAIADHAEDLFAVMDFFGLRKAPVVGWCSGGEVALQASLRQPARMEKIILVNSYFSLKAVQDTPISKDLVDIVKIAARGMKEAEMLSSMISRAGAKPQTLGLEEDKEIYDWVAGPFNRGPEALYRYSLMLSRLYTNEFETWGNRVTMEVDVLWGERDLIVPVINLPAVRRVLKPARFDVIEQGDHYSLFRESGVLESIIRKIR
jgi:pimeloyl-ACP methyl ester carboxylesterase